jgi:hypothetical protein
MVAPAGNKESEVRELRELQARVKSKNSLEDSISEFVEGVAGILEGSGVQDSRVLSTVNDLRARKTEWSHAIRDNTEV